MTPDYSSILHQIFNTEDLSRLSVILSEGKEAEMLRSVIAACPRLPHRLLSFQVVQSLFNHAVRSASSVNSLVDPLLDAINSDSPWLRSVALSSLSRTGLPDVLPLLFAKSESMSDALSSIRALGVWQGSTQPVLDYLQTRIDEQVGKPHNNRLHSKIREAEETGDDSDLMLTVELALSSALLQNHNTSWLLCGLSSMDNQFTSVTEPIRLRATSALRYTAGAGVADSFLNAVCSGYSQEMVGLGVSGLRLLGSRNALDLLIKALGSAKSEFISIIQGSFKDLSGLWPLGQEIDQTHSPAEIIDWWTDVRESFREDVCYYRGQPFSPWSIVDELEGQCSLTRYDDLKVLTGFSPHENVIPSWLLEDPVNALSRTATQWWSVKKSDYLPGRFYRSGHMLSQELQRACFDPL